VILSIFLLVCLVRLRPSPEKKMRAKGNTRMRMRCWEEMFLANFRLAMADDSRRLWRRSVYCTAPLSPLCVTRVWMLGEALERAA